MSLIAALAIVTAAIAAPAVPIGKYQLAYPFPNSGGTTVFFQGNFDGRWQLYEMDTASGTIRRLHSSEKDDTHPALSPDGTKLAFISNRTGNDELWLLDLSTAQARILSPHPGKDGHPKWSPDGLSLVFNRTFDPSDKDGDIDSAILQVRLDGSPPRIVSDTPNVETFASFSPDGQSIAFIEWFPASEGARNTEITVVDLQSGARRRLTNSTEFDAYPYWAKDGWIYFSTVMKGPRGPEAILSRIRPDGERAERLADLDGVSEMRAIPQADGNAIWFNRNDSGRTLIYRHSITQP